MKKAIFCLFAAAAANYALAGYAWYSEEINAILAKMPSKYYTKVDVTLWGSFGNGIWTPPYAKYDYSTGKFIVDNANSLRVTSFADLNKYGEYDVEKSIDNFFLNCGLYITDKYDQPYTVYDETVIAFYTQYEQMNFSEAKQVFDSLKSTFEMWRSDAVSSKTVLETDVSELAELTKEIKEKLGDAKEEIAKTVEDSKRVSENLNNELQDVRENLTKISEEAVYEAQKKIESTVTDFNSFIDKLETAIELDEWDDTAFEGAYDELSKSEQDLIDAITELQKSSGNTEAQQAITVLQGQLVGVSALKSSLRTAINNKDKNLAKSILSSAKRSDFYNSKKAISKLNNKLKELKSKEKVLDLLVEASLSTMNEQDDLKARIEKLQDSFSSMIIISMDNFHQINAYLCSTNSMKYLEKRYSMGDKKVTLDDFTTDELARWIGITTQDPLFRNSKDVAEYGSITKMTPKGSVLGYYNNIMRLLSSSCFMTYFDLNTTARFESAYTPSPFLLDGFRGFWQKRDLDGSTGNYTTNWYANKITAPKNWADETSIIVTNGKFKAIASGYALKVVGTTASNYKLIGAPASKTNTVTFASASDSNVAVTVGGIDDHITVTIGVYYK